MAKSALVCADHILEPIANIEDDISGYDFENFRANRRIRQLVERNLEIISEASRRLPDSLKAQTPEIPWEGIAGIGNILRHDYHKAYPTILWQTCHRDLEPLKTTVLRIRNRLGPANPV